MTLTINAPDQHTDHDWDRKQRLAAVGVEIAEHGLDAHRELIREIANAGRRLAPAAANVLADETEPAVARERAYAVVSAALTRTLEHH